MFPNEKEKVFFKIDGKKLSCYFQTKAKQSIKP